ncbi:MAG: hypothetical protein ACRDTC_10445 [Pseudonocardiaceae bacterium]
MLGPQPELVWRGRIHLGDEPGVFGDAFYAGLATELPVTVQKTDPTGPDTTTLVVVTQNVETFSGYPGHLITATLYEEDPDQEFHSIETVLATQRLTSTDDNRREITLDLAGKSSPAFVSVRVRIDTEVPPGLYDDFVVTGLLNTSENFTFVAALGYRS